MFTTLNVEKFQVILNLNMELAADQGKVAVDQRVPTLHRAMVRACDGAARRVRKTHARMYAWWTTEIGSLHVECVRLRRSRKRLTRAAHRLRGDEGMVPTDGAARTNTATQQEYEVLNITYREAKRCFRRALTKQKILCWKDPISNLDRDP